MFFQKILVNIYVHPKLVVKLACLTTLIKEMENFKLPSKQHIFFYGIRRSGNHAVLDWLLHNLSGDRTRFKIKHRLMASGNSCYLNAVNEYIQRKDSWIDYSFAKFT